MRTQCWQVVSALGIAGNEYSRSGIPRVTGIRFPDNVAAGREEGGGIEMAETVWMLMALDKIFHSTSNPQRNDLRYSTCSIYL